MPANLPRVEFQPGRELRQKVEAYRREMSEKLKRRVSTSEVVVAILDDFFSRTRFESKK